LPFRPVWWPRPYPRPGSLNDRMPQVFNRHRIQSYPFFHLKPMQKTLYILGPPALSSFRLQKRLAEIVQEIPTVSYLSAHFVHFISLANPDIPLGPEEQGILIRVLDYGALDVASAEADPKIGQEPPGQLILVTPRPGTVSPWSSKASDIAHHCRLTAVNRIERGIAFHVATEDGVALEKDALTVAADLLHDPMTQMVFYDLDDIDSLFLHASPEPLQRVPLLDKGEQEARLAELERANRDLGLALSDQEIRYLVEGFAEQGRDPSDVELMMFSQVNSEHCRHKIFNSDWIIDGSSQARSLFAMIRRTYSEAPDNSHILGAYADNSAVMKAEKTEDRSTLFYPHSQSRRYESVLGDAHILMKVETHNHPTAISPYPGAATGSGGEIRDEAATGRGARAKAGLTGFSVSNLRIPDFLQPWEQDFGKPARIASALEIMLEAPIGAAGFNNEFGRPALLGYFRTFEGSITDDNGETEVRGYHKPIMIAGGMGNIRAEQVEKQPLSSNASIVVLGGPAMLIGLGGGAASSMTSGTTKEALDFASVQRDNAEMQRRCQEVIDRCWQMEQDNPILSIHDVGAGGLSNALPELVHGGGRGGRFELRTIPNDDPGMSPLALWCNESQERYVLAVVPEKLERFLGLCEKERCPCAVVGEATEALRLHLTDELHTETGSDPMATRADLGTPIDIPLEFLFGNPPRMVRDVARISWAGNTSGEGRGVASLPALSLENAAHRVLRLPTVANKGFLITIGDRTVTGLVVRDQMVGPWQVPVADCAVTASGFDVYTGEVMAMGERTPVALTDGPASGRLAVAEAITNIAAAPIRALDKVVLSANWMAACGHPGEDAKLFDTVRAVAEELCQALGIVIPVGKDSLSMKTVWEQDGRSHAVTAPLSLIVSAFTPVLDVRKTLTPQLRTDIESDLILIDLGRGQNRLGGSCLAQVFGQSVGEVADLDRPQDLQAFFQAIQDLNRDNLLLAYHDRSDGGLFVTLCEMAFAGHTGVSVHLDGLGTDPISVLFAEEPGAVLQVAKKDREAVLRILRSHNELAEHVHLIGAPDHTDRIRCHLAGDIILGQSRITLQEIWSETSYRMQSLRDNPLCAEQEYQAISDPDDPGLSPHLGFDPSAVPPSRVQALSLGGARPKVAILREQGVNGHVEMAGAFHRAGFDCFDVHMSEIISGEVTLADYRGLAACGGFSYGDVLGGGGGWANSILYNPRARETFAEFFFRSDTFSLGICNGCQMLSQLTDLIPGADYWPRFVRNLSEQFEARLVLCEVLCSPSLFLTGMEGSRLPIVVAHGEGRAVSPVAADQAEGSILDSACLRYVDNQGVLTERYPANPNGSPGGLTGFTSFDGRVTIMMPHPERLFRSCQYSWHPDDWPEDGPWVQMFRNARAWV